MSGELDRPLGGCPAHRDGSHRTCRPARGPRRLEPRVQPDYTFARVLDGFSAVVDPSAIPVIEQDEDVQGVYPVRIAYPASMRRL